MRNASLLKFQGHMHDDLRVGAKWPDQETMIAAYLKVAEEFNLTIPETAGAER